MANLFFPLLSSASLSQYPFRKERRLRTITNVLQDGRLIQFQDADSSSLNWTLNFTGLNFQDANLLRAHFEACSGPLYPFTFPDPTDNLLCWSSDLFNPIWVHADILQIGRQVLDPLGSTNAFMLTNNSQAFQDFLQTIPIPAYFSHCFSLYARSSYSTKLQLVRQGSSAQESISISLSEQWTRYQIAGPLADSATQTSFGFSVCPGDQIEIFGPQVEIQKFPSTYVPTGGTSGLYTNTFFRDQQFSLTAQAHNAFAVTLGIQAFL